ncbi:MAG: PDZ domain-containing protein, partial [Longimicrobiales bacterium]|nr:PDZ domain-containing protein [Longimicrobiales bacterium]
LYLPTAPHYPTPPEVPPVPRRLRSPAAVVLLALPLLALACAPADSTAGRAGDAPPVRYEISFDDRMHNEARVSVHYTELPPGETLEMRMSRSSPGRYAIHEFAKNVYEVAAVDGDGQPLPITRPDPYQWDVTGHGGEATVTYTLFANRAGGTYSGIDETHAHLNIPATFMWARGHFARPVEVTVHLPEGSGWEVATQLAPTDDPEVWTAPSHDYFMDSPMEIADLDWREWEVGEQTIRIAMHHLGTDAELDAYAAQARSIVEEEAAVYGELPAFDHGTYTFLACYVPWASGDGMEHRNSTVLTSSGSLETSMLGLLGTVAHEFFHAWNIERIRPAALEPFDFERANMSRELWFGEGFTSYYDDLAMMRAGVLDVGQFARSMGGAVNAVTNSPGRNHFSPVEMSMQAPFVDAATSIDPTNRANTFISYYTWGSVVGLGLDLVLRERFPGVTLDDVMRAMWERHGAPEIPYTVDDIEAALAEVTGDADFAARFFDRYIRGSLVPDFERLFAQAGLELRPARPDAAILARARLVAGEGGLTVASAPLEGTPLYAAGASAGDVVLAVGGQPTRTPGDLARLLAARAPGDAVEVTFRSLGEEYSATVELIADPALVVVPVEADGGALTEAQAAFREAWLGG